MCRHSSTLLLASRPPFSLPLLSYPSLLRCIPLHPFLRPGTAGYQWRGYCLAANGATLHASHILASDELKQRTDEWYELRQNRLTASSFSTALGFWGIDRQVELWEEKVGLRDRFSGNPATEWGSNQEACAVKRYQEVTGNVVQFLGFQIYKEGDDVQGWLGASPDGLIETNLLGEKGGILEVKCPYNKGKPELCIPWASAPYYYMPQMQGLMEILDRDWLDLFVWTLNGFSIFRVDRDAAFWALMYGVLSDFWWATVVPAKQSILLRRNIDVTVYRPTGLHRITLKIIEESRKLAAKAPLIQQERIKNI